MMGPLIGAAAGAVAATADVVAGPRLSILIFHRVHAEPDPLFPGEMHAARFDKLCAMLARGFEVMGLCDALDARANGRLPARAVAITFDDGYADNAEVALPILRRHGLTATFFVATGFLDGGRMWNDTVIESVRSTSAADVRMPTYGIDSMPLATLADRRSAIERLLPVVKYMTLDERERALVALRHALGEPLLPDNLMMRSDQVLELHRAGMEIGGHTVRHPILRAVPDDLARREIDDGRAQLESIIGANVHAFAYPNGGPDRDYDLRHVKMVQDAGFRAAVSTATGVVGAAADPFQLPRFAPWDEGLGRWSARLLRSRLGSQSHRTAALSGPSTT